MIRPDDSVSGQPPTGRLPADREEKLREAYRRDRAEFRIRCIAYAGRYAQEAIMQLDIGRAEHARRLMGYVVAIEELETELLTGVTV